MITILLICSSFSLHANTDENSHYEQALSAFNKGDLEGSYIHLKNSLQQQPENLPTKILIGKVLLQSGYALEAEIELLEALELGADPSLVAKTLAMAVLLQQEYEDVNQLVFNKLTPQAQIDLDVVKATAHMLDGASDKAKDVLLRIVNQQPNNIEALNLLADIALSSGNLKLAQDYVTRVKAITQQSLSTIRIQAEILERGGDDVEAEKVYLNGLSINPSEPILIRNLASLLVRNQRFDEAQLLVGKILAETPSDPMGTLLNSWILVQKNQSDEALQALDSLSNAISNLPSEVSAASPDFVFIQGLAHFAAGKYESARNFFTEFVQRAKKPEEAVVFLVDVHLKLGESSDALKLLERFPSTVEENLELAAIAIDVYLNTNRLHRAISLVETLQVKYPSSSAVAMLKARVLQYRGRLDEALTVLSSDAFGNTEAHLLARAQLYLDAGQFSDAINEINELIEREPNNPDYYNLKGAALIKLGKTDEAEIVVRKSLQLNPQHFAAKFNLATVLAAQGEERQAETILLQLLEELPNHERSVVLLAQIEANTQRPVRGLNRLSDYLLSNPSAINAREVNIELLIRAQRFKQANQQLNELLKRSNLSNENSLRKAQIHIGLNEIDNARLEYTRLSTLWSGNASELYKLSLLQSAIGDFSGAITSLQMAAEASPMSLLIQKELIRNFLALNDTDTAQKLLDSMVRKDKETANTYMLRGDIERVRKNLTLAYKYYKQSLKIDNRFNQALIKMYQVTDMLLGKTDFSATVEKILITQPDLAFHRNLLADYYLSSLQFERAEGHLRILAQLKDFGNRALVLNNLANILLANGASSEALDFSKEAYAINPESAAIVDTYGWAMAKEGQFEQALSLLRRAYAMDSADPSIQYHLGYTLIKLGNTVEGKKELKNAIASPLDFLGKQQAIALFEQTS